MRDYNKKAFQISLFLFLSLSGFTALIGITHAAPPDPYNYGRKGFVYNHWVTRQWELRNFLAVDYYPDEDTIHSYTIQGSEAKVYTIFWDTYGYYSNGGYQSGGDSAIHYTRAYFEHHDGNYKVKVWYTNSITTAYSHSWDWGLEVIYGGSYPIGASNLNW